MIDGRRAPDAGGRHRLVQKVPELLQPAWRRCNEAVGLSYEVIVVENASADGSAELVRDEFPSFRLIALEENTVAAGSNLGVRAAEGEHILLLNPDTELVGDVLDALLRYARAHPEAGLVGGRTLTPDGELDAGSCWGAQSLWSLTCFATGLSTILRGSRLFNPESLAGWRRDSPREVDVVTGCLCLARRTVWEELGGFDEAFFMYGEDADLSARAHKLGYHPAITPEAVIIHHVGASSLSVDKREMNCAAAWRWRASTGRRRERQLPWRCCKRAPGYGRWCRRRPPSVLDLARRVAPSPLLARRLRLSRNGVRSTSGSRPSTRSAAAFATVGANLKPWPENPAHTTVRSSRRSTTAVSVGVSA
jgi:GT2 family glycosyltransferase